MGTPPSSFNTDFHSVFKRQELRSPNDPQRLVIEPGYRDVGFQFFDSHQNRSRGAFADFYRKGISIENDLPRPIDKVAKDFALTAFVKPSQLLREDYDTTYRQSSSIGRRSESESKWGKRAGSN